MRTRHEIEELIQDARHWPRHLEGNLINQLADALTEALAETEQARRTALHDALRAIHDEFEGKPVRDVISAVGRSERAVRRLLMTSLPGAGQ